MIRASVAAFLVLATFSAVAASIDDTLEPRDLAERVRPDLCGTDYFDTNPIRRIDYSGFFPTQEAAVSALATIDENVFSLDAREAADGPDWVATALYKKLPTLEEFSTHRKQLQLLGMVPGCMGYLYSR